jgi:hypothetical protein
VFLVSRLSSPFLRFTHLSSTISMESLEGLWEKFSLSEHECQKVDLASTTTQPKSFLAAKFLTRRVLNVESVARTFKPLWRTDQGFSIRDMNDNKLVFVFEDEADRERVMLGEPWAYDKSLVVFQRIEDEEAIEEVTFTETSFWVQLHGIPVRRMNEEVARILGSSLGRIAQVTGGTTAANGGQAMRIRVSIDITKPLCRGRMAMLEKGREVWISFKYERLPNFCYWCGHVTHSDKDCPYWLRNQETLQLEDQQFGPWLRASNERPWRQTEIRIEGILRPPPPQSKQPKQAPPPPPPNPFSSHTQINVPHPPIIPIAPPSPPHQPSPNPYHTTTLPQQYNTPSPPQTAAPVDHPPLTNDDYPTNMELEENPGYVPIFSEKIKQVDDFESQIREIDQALNYVSPNLEIFPKPIPLPKPNLSPSQHTPRVVLGDVTNKKEAHVGEKKLPVAKRSWKKLARSQGISEDRFLDPINIKRSSNSLEDNNQISPCLKKQCGANSMSISAEAVVQPRRQP